MWATASFTMIFTINIVIVVAIAVAWPIAAPRLGVVIWVRLRTTVTSWFMLGA